MVIFRLACKEVYHIMIFICTASSGGGGGGGGGGGECIIVSYPGSTHTLSLQYETGFVCKCDSIEMRILLNINGCNQTRILSILRHCGRYA